MVKKTSHRSRRSSSKINQIDQTPFINRLEFPFMPFFVLAVAFVLLIFTLSPYLLSSFNSQSKIIICGGSANLPCPQSMTCVLDGIYPDATGTCRP